MEDFHYAGEDELKIQLSDEKTDMERKPQENSLSAAAPLMEMLHLTSVYNGVKVPSILFDSTGTKKIAALASYVIDALENNRILVIDELDNSLHFKLTRGILALFNNELNEKAQLIWTARPYFVRSKSGLLARIKNTPTCILLPTLQQKKITFEIPAILSKNIRRECLARFRSRSVLNRCWR